MNASLGENQDTSEKRIFSSKAGYLKGIPDLNIIEPNVIYNGLFIKYKSPTLKGISSADQFKNIQRLIMRNYKCIVSDDYDDLIKYINTSDDEAD